jgi:hypothetical protein
MIKKLEVGQSLEVVAVCFTFFLGNYLLQAASADWPLNVLSNTLYLGISIVLLLLKRRTQALFLLALYPACFHRYFADPYDTSFSDFFAGPWKLVPFFALLSAAKPISIRPLPIIFFTGIAASTLAHAVWRRSGEYVLSDVIFYTVVLTFLSIDVEAVKRRTAQLDIERTLFYFYASIAITYPILWFTNTYVEQYGSIYFFWGHVYGFLMIYGLLFYTTRLTLKERLWFALPVLVNSAVFLQSMQSAHLVILFGMLCMYSYWYRRFSFLLVAVVAALCLVWLSTILDPTTFLFLKVYQILDVFSVRSLEDLVNNNSVFIRVSQFVSIFSQNSLLEHLIGNGLGATYGDPLHLFAIADLHDKTYTEQELQTGVFFLIHEPVVKLYFNCGVLGLSLFLYTVYKILRFSGRQDSLMVLTAICFTLLWSASTQIAFLLLQVFILQAAFARRTGITHKDSSPYSPRVALSPLRTS